MSTPAAGAARRPTRRLLPRDERQAQLLRAAATAFAHAGFAGTSMEDVASAAGVTKLIVYRHFDSKDELYRAVLLQVALRCKEEFERGVAAAGGFRPGIAIRCLLMVARENPDGFRLLTRHARREPQFATIAQLFVSGAEGISASVIGERIPDPVVKAWAQPVIIDYLIETVLSWLDVGEPGRDDEFVQLAGRGLRGLFLAWAEPAGDEA
jgi:AcrR family transcriptional regulator